MRGETTASPPATVLMAATSSAGGTSLRRKPLAPARSALKAYSSRSKVVRMSTRVLAAGVRRRDGPGGLNPVEDGHAHIHEDHVGPVELDEAHGVRPVAPPPRRSRVLPRPRGSCGSPCAAAPGRPPAPPGPSCRRGGLAVAQQGLDLPAAAGPGPGGEGPAERGWPVRPCPPSRGRPVRPRPATATRLRPSSVTRTATSGSAKVKQHLHRRAPPRRASGRWSGPPAPPGRPSTRPPRTARRARRRAAP